MARGINKVILIGNLGADPETRYTANGSAISNISLATSESWRDKQSGELQERTEWHRVVFFNRLAEIVNEYVKKGAKLYIEGSLRTRKWQDKSGADRYTTEIVATEMQMLDGRSGAPAHAQSSNAYDSSYDNHSNQHQSNQSSQGGNAPSHAADPGFPDEEIPF